VPETTLRSHLAYLLSAAEQAVNRGLAEALAAEGVTVEQWRILRALSDGRGHSMGDLAGEVLMPHPTLTKAVDRLIDGALVYRRQDEADRRRVVVFLADRGKELVRGLDEQADEHHHRIEAAYGALRTERLMRELGRLVDSLGSRSTVD
jgi:MarR family transcriptional regulator, organic hydroperoxide resistance regulator